MPNLSELFVAHQDKISDKWSSNIEFYDNCLKPFKDRPIRLLEIGVQNGGSLEIWAKYFPNATRLVGCDINEKCRDLEFADSRISVIVGDINDLDVLSRVKLNSDEFDLIIDDGSHRSGDIVRTFATYFHILSQGGLFIAEDLHCSYWEGYDGGVEHPGSSMSFFRRLTDYVNIEHWGASVPPEEMLSYFAERWGTRFDPEDLKRIAEVRFRNSLAVVFKDAPDKVSLGMRIIAGYKASVHDEVLGLNGTRCNPIPQQTNVYGPHALRRERTPDLLASRDRERLELFKARDDLQRKNETEAQERDRERDRQTQEIGALTRQLHETDQKLAQSRGEREAASRAQIKAERLYREIVASSSWRLTAPLRRLIDKVRGTRAS